MVNIIQQHSMKRKEATVINTHFSNQTLESMLENFDERRRKEFFLKDQIPSWVAIPGYICLAGLSIGVIPVIFPQLKPYHVLVAYLMAPILAFCNAYGCGLTDWSLASNYGKMAIMVFSSWVGLENGGVLAGLASCGVIMSIVSTASDLMQDFKTGYLTLASPRSMFFSQVFGTAIGCLFSPLIFWFFYKAYSVGDPTGSYPAPYGPMYRGMALLGVEGVASLPKNCLEFAIWFFVAALLINLITHLFQRYETRYRIYRFIPSPMCIAIPFYLGGYFSIDMCIGSLILLFWGMKNKQMANDFGPAVASGLICGESLWGVPAAMLSLAGLNAPICMKFLSASTNNKIDAILSGLWNNFLLFILNYISHSSILLNHFWWISLVLYITCYLFHFPHGHTMWEGFLRRQLMKPYYKIKWFQTLCSINNLTYAQTYWDPGSTFLHLPPYNLLNTLKK